ncbi:ribosomal protein S18 acetylase RimI-like enzyme [Paenibacillus castaneae]|uniref:GNAT family N-acetyltransferase n=1 Tax=Paenibacillus castaneae TaxID=474957 RepID=UPI000C9CCDB8|nr:GNAT family N-acetyltransferase [Paenibacillus castaneae]NIK75805.1 ribosomal protein S18 acetylase RimI-like enzyme [Paenibacillus castaneae]
MIKAWDNQYIHDVISLWNKEALKDGYKELTEADFRHIFLSSSYFKKETTFVWLESDEVKGFACGCTGDDLPLGDIAGYITCIVVSSDNKKDENSRLMLQALEFSFQQLGKKQADILFFNPMLLPWYIPDTPKHEHNNAPGVPLDSELYSFLLSCGYKVRSIQCAMYLNLSFFSIPDDIKAKENKAAAEGYRVEMFDPAKHSGVKEMVAIFNNPLWKKQIPDYTASGVPMVIAAYKGKAVGFAGPVIRQDNGRAYFAGIGVHPEHEGHGLGSILFFRLCEAFRSIDAVYMSLFTGSTNPAIRIYEKAGFQPAKQFAVMRREF